MLHPGYPLLVVAVYEWLERHPDWRVLCVIDREDIVAAAKFVLCHKDVVPLFEQDLMDTLQGAALRARLRVGALFLRGADAEAAAGGGGLIFLFLLPAAGRRWRTASREPDEAVHAPPPQTWSSAPSPRCTGEGTRSYCAAVNP